MAWWNRQPEVDERICDVNLTPLIDVSLTLVVILLLATPLAFESAIGVRSAEAAARKARSQEDVARIELTIVSEDSMRINRVLVPRDRLEAAVRPLLERSPTRQVVIACGDGISHGTFVDVLDRSKRSGAGSIAVQGR
jgi:biopolymer transport protein ExbD